MPDSMYYDAATGLTHYMELTTGNSRTRYWLHCAPPLGRSAADEVAAGDEDNWPNITLRNVEGAFVTCLWCTSGRRRS